jgi:polyhydroxybutyrate depolymerase
MCQIAPVRQYSMALREFCNILPSKEKNVRGRRWAGPGSFALILLVSIFLLPVSGDQSKLPPLRPGNYSFKLRYGGLDRTWLVHMPPQAANHAPLAMVLNFHGATSNGKQEEAYSNMDAAADRDGFIAVYPNGTGRFPNHYTWNAGTCCGYAMFRQIDDVGFVKALIDWMAARTPVDRHRVYATGISNGGMISYRLAAQAPDYIAAIAPVAGTMVARDISPGHPMPIMAFNSVDDPILHYGGGYGSSRYHRDLGNPGVEPGLARWRAANGCPEQPQIGPTISGKDGSGNKGVTVTNYAWGPCHGDTEIVLWKFTGSGHVWPGGIQNRWVTFLGRGTNLIDANEEMWKFFSRYALPEN